MLFVLVASAVVAANWWVSVKQPQDKPVLVVNSRVFRWSEYMTLLRFQKLATQQLGQPFQAGQEPYHLMHLMTQNELINQAAVREGLHITQAELRHEMTSRLVPKAKEITDPAQLDKELDVRLTAYLDNVQLSRAGYEDLIRQDLYRQQLANKLGVTIARVQPQAFLHLIEAASDQSDQVNKDLTSGTLFETVARRVSKEPNVQTNGGEIGWVPKLVYRDLDTQVFGMKEGEVSHAIETKNGWWLVRVIERVQDGAHLQGIFLKDLPAVDVAQKRLREGRAFPDVAAQVSTDAATKAARGDMGIVKIGVMGAEVDEVIRGVPEGQLIGPVMTGQSALFAIVKKRTPAQEVAPEHFDVLKQRALDNWLTKESAAATVDYCPDKQCFGSVKVDAALKELSTLSLTRSQEATATAAARPSGGQGMFPGAP